MKKVYELIRKIGVSGVSDEDLYLESSSDLYEQFTDAESAFESSRDILREKCNVLRRGYSAKGYDFGDGVRETEWDDEELHFVLSITTDITDTNRPRIQGRMRIKVRNVH